jgi:2-hydroxy-6-oxonona-2,4-dienedioate hydrolase
VTTGSLVSAPSAPALIDREPDVVVALLARTELHRVDHQGRFVNWRTLGDGPPLVLLHGGHGNWLHWVRNIDALAARHRVWVPDMPGFGQSDDLDGHPHDPRRLDRLVEALRATLEGLAGAVTIDLAGFSFGGLVAAQLAVRLAEARGGVGRLALLGPGGHGGGRPRDVELADWRLNDPAARHAALRQNLEAFMLHDRRAADALALSVHAQACEATRFRSKALSRAGGLQVALDRAACPVLLVWGEHDVTGVPAELGPALCADRPQRHWMLVPEAGHWVQYEAADTVNARLIRWFGDERVT